MRLTVDSPALRGSAYGIEEIAPRYACKADSVWLPLEWSGVPDRTAEIAVSFVVRAIEFNEGGFSSRLDDVWLIGKLDPARGGLAVGPLPSGSFLAGHGAGDLPPGQIECPPLESASGLYITVYALPRGYHAPTGLTGMPGIQDLESNQLASGSIGALYRVKGNSPQAPGQD